LPSSTVFGLCQDKEGYIWMATNNGVSRFDGTSFKVFTTENGLPDNFILKVHQDGKGRIWFLSLSGKLSFYLDGKIHNDKTDLFLKAADMQSAVAYFNEDVDNNLWFNNNILIVKIDKHDNVTVFDNNYFKTHFGLEVRNISMPWINSKGYFSFLIHYNQLYYYIRNEFQISPKVFYYQKSAGENKKRFDPKEFGAQIYAQSPKGKKLYFSNTTSIMEIKNDVVERLYKCDYIKNNGVFSILEDTYNNIWLSTSSGVLFFEKGILNQNYKLFFKNVFFSDAILDKEDNIWFSTLGNGLFMIPSAKTFIYNHENPIKDGIFVKLGVSHTGEILAASINGHLYDFDSGTSSFKTVPTFKTHNNNRSFYGIIANNKNQTWIIGGNNISEFDGKKFKYLNLENTISWFKSAIPSHHGSIWIGGGGQLYELINNKIFLRYSFNHIIRMFSLLETGDSLLVGTEKGLYVYKNSSMRLLNSNDPAFTSSINDLGAGIGGTIWAAARNEGVFIISGKNVYHIRKIDGLISDNINRILIYNNLVFIASSTGLNRIKYQVNQKGELSITEISEENLPVCEVNDLILKDSMLWLASSIGIIKFPIYSITKKLPSAPTYLTDFSANHISLSLIGNHVLSYYQNNIEIKYTGISYSSFGQVSFRYRLSPYPDWNYTTSTTVVLPALATGDYLFEVQTKNLNGIWNPVSAVIKFQIDTPFWKKWWFIYLANACLILCIFLFLKRRVRRIRKEENILRKNLQTELNALRAQMNPHFIFNSLNAIQDFVLSNQKNEASAYLSDFARLMRLILENSRKQFITLSEEIDFLQYYIRLEQLRFQKKFDFVLKVDPAIDKDNARLPSMWIQPFVENAILHGLSKLNKHGILLISFEIKESFLRCIIDDNGLGREFVMANKVENENNKHHSTAMKIIYERLKIYNTANKDKIHQYIEDKAECTSPENGTRIIIDFPQ